MRKIIKKDRISFDTLFLSIVKLLELRSTCLRRKVGAVLVRDNIILATGYNGVPRGLSHCQECIRDKYNIPSGQRMEFSRAVHAEQNVLIQCALKQTNPESSVLYCSCLPCVTCSKMLIQAGVKKIVYIEDYDDGLNKEILKESNIELIQFTNFNFGDIL